VAGPRQAGSTPAAPAQIGSAPGVPAQGGAATPGLTADRGAPSTAAAPASAPPSASERPETPAAPAPAPAAPAAPAPAPASPGLAGLTSADRPATLRRAPGTVAAMVRIAEARGVTHARVALKPVELGAIEIHIARSAAGVTAQIIADSPEAARALQQAAGELRRALEASDVKLLSLEVSTSGEERREAAAGEGAGGDRSSSAGSGRRGAAAGEPDEMLIEPIREGVIELPDGVLVDVLA
jgi:flagellar hook-length control protein FliK